MTVKTITFNLPETVYQQVQQIAQIWQKPTERVLVDTVVTGLPFLDDLPLDLIDDMATLLLLNDAALAKAACRTMSDKNCHKLEDLLAFQGMRALSNSEQGTLDALIREYEVILVTRAEAAILLQQRGYDISSPAIFNSHNGQPPTFYQQLLNTAEQNQPIPS